MDLGKKVINNIHWTVDILKIAAAFVLVLVNGFFVAVDIVLVKLREGQLKDLFLKAAALRQNSLMAPAQTGCLFTWLSIGYHYGVFGSGVDWRPAIAHLLRPLLMAVVTESDIWLHGIAFFIAFTLITAAHLVFDAQTPKIICHLRSPITLAL